MTPLSGRVAIVTGASRGLGRQAALALAGAGAAVVAAGRDRAALDETCALVASVGPSALPVVCDVTDEEQVDALTRSALDRYGRIDVLVNNAGIASEHRALDLDVAEFRRVLETNVIGTFLPARAVAAHMRDRGGGAVVNIGSVMGRSGTSGLSHYGASKAAVFQLTRGWAVEWARYGIRVNCLALGYFPTGINRDRLAEEGVAGRVLARVPARRFGDPAEIGPTVVHLASDASRYMTGQVVYLDGGMSAR